MNRRDDLDQLIEELAEDDPDLPRRVDAAFERRVLARQLADRRRHAGLTQAQIADRMGTSQGQVARFESGADTRLSTVARYGAAIGVHISWSLDPLPPPKAARPRSRTRRAAKAKKPSAA
jgi:transcriptional regulator with XRE-family HTH domain